ncbi:MAG TPA: hypothetical protein IAB68_01035 [Candidatus Aphodocola excrementigallinarum]|uniref:Lipoprotein n=1 Tax=Candidatus Aphodocola excrementigallinarum TaxID=2840670 RepID=A0A9D1INJ4_9FIRM|nr:hypothetical protein [Candidatus Aphodocola excrementigallinarum]
MKKCLLFLLCLVLLSGCTITRMDNKTYEEVIDSILSLNINLYNKVGKGYKYYAPRGVVRLDSNTYNDVLKRNDIIYYLYVDVVSYYYKTDINYTKSKNAYYSSNLKYKNKTGYVEITKNKNNLYVQMVYNYAKIETYVDEKDLNQALEDISYILSSVSFNDSLLNKMYEEGAFDSNEEVYRLFDNKEKEGNFLEYVEEYDKYDEQDEAVAPEEEIKIKETTTTTTTRQTTSTNTTTTGN